MAVPYRFRCMPIQNEIMFIRDNIILEFPVERYWIQFENYKEYPLVIGKTHHDSEQVFLALGQSLNQACGFFD